MVIYGVALLAACLLTGKVMGELIGMAIGVHSDVGGVGIAMLLLVFLVHRMQQAGSLDMTSRRGVEFWNFLYIPIVVAMAASQNVIGAVTGGTLAIVGGLSVVAVSFALVPLIARLGNGKHVEPLPPIDAAKAQGGDRHA